jgi:hypothetical protein
LMRGGGNLALAYGLFESVGTCNLCRIAIHPAYQRLLIIVFRKSFD